MKALIRKKAEMVVVKLRGVRDSAEKHQWIMPKQYPNFDKERPGMVVLTK